MKIAEVMTTDVVSVRPDTSLKDVARILSSCGISGMPVVDDAGQVVGVISEADILSKERRRPEETLSGRMLGRLRRDGAKWNARTAGEAMTAPAITISPQRWLDAAAALMLDRGVNRLPVVDRDGRLAGIVTRADLVRAFASGDDRISREIREDVLRRDLWLDPDAFELAVDEGEVELRGQFDSAAQRDVVEQRVRLVPGVVAIRIRETVGR